MSEPRRLIQIQIANREDGRAVPAEQQAAANEKSIAELKQFAAERGIILRDSPLVEPDQTFDQETVDAIQAIAGPLMSPSEPTKEGEDAHQAGVLLGTRTETRSVTIEPPGKPKIKFEKTVTEKGLVVGGHSRGIGDVIEKMHEFGVKICVTITDGIVRLFGRERREKDQAEEKKHGEK